MSNVEYEIVDVDAWEQDATLVVDGRRIYFQFAAEKANALTIEDALDYLVRDSIYATGSEAWQRWKPFPATAPTDRSILVSGTWNAPHSPSFGQEAVTETRWGSYSSTGTKGFHWSGLYYPEEGTRALKPRWAVDWKYWTELPRRTPVPDSNPNRYPFPQPNPDRGYLEP